MLAISRAVVRLSAFVAIVLTCQTSLAQDLISDLEGYWPMDEGSGTVAGDVSGNDRPAEFRNGEPQWVDGIFGKALEFDGDDDLEVAWRGIGEDRARTVSFWIKSEWTDVVGNNAIVGWGLSETSRKWHIRFDEKDATIRTEPEGGQNWGSTPLNDGEWHHVVSLFPEGGVDMADLEQYVDGVLEETNGNTGIAVDTATDEGLDLTIGSRFQTDQGDGFWQGIIDDLRIYSRALTEEEIVALSNGEGLIPMLPGDFNNDGVLDALDVNDLTAQSAGGTNPPKYDLDGDTLVNSKDVNVWARDLFGTWIGDADLNGEFDTADLVTVLASGTYEIDTNSVWSTGDFNGDGRTDSGDLVAALSDGGYEAGPRAATAAVPEPSTFGMIVMAGAALSMLRRPFKVNEDSSAMMGKA